MTFIPIYILILAVTILIDYFAGILIEKEAGKKKKLYLIISILSTCLVLFIFKYFNFFNANMQKLAEFLHWNYSIGSLSLILPIGLSFHTFQSLSYVIEVYRGNQKAEKNFGIYALYVMFYPQLVAGPIERPQNLLHQFYEEHYFDYKRVTDGLKLMAWGMFKKVVVADRLAVYVDIVYKNPSAFDGISLIIATIFFAFQIYADFSGYSDVAIGSAQVMGFKLMTNFNRPYYSKSISEFWKRWHISLSTWFRDYLYIPLGGNRVAKWRWQLNLFIVFLVSGLWHGANWTYVIWGALHGFYLVFSIWTQKIRDFMVNIFKLKKVPAVHKFIQVAITFSLVCFAWIFFRATSISSAMYIVTHLHVNLANDLAAFAHSIYLSFQSGKMLVDFTPITGQLLWLQTEMTFKIAVISIIAMETIHFIQRRGSIRNRISQLPAVVRWSGYFLLMFSIWMFGYFSNQNFIYFQF